MIPMEAPKLRVYQEAMCSLIQNAFRKHKHVLAVAATGSGKTFMFSNMALSSVNKGFKVLILSNRAKLLRQSGGALAKFGMDAEYISAKHKSIPVGNIAIAMAQTLQRRWLQDDYQEYLRSVDFFIFDEAHLNDFNFLLESDILKDKWLLGVTATPRRSGKMRQFGLDYSILIEGLSAQSGIDLGFLVPAKHFTLDAPDLSKVAIDPHTADFNSKELYKTFNNAQVYGGLVSEFKRLGNNEKSIVFCCNQMHAIRTCVMLNDAGISSKFVVSGIEKSSEDYQYLQDNLHLTGKKEDIEEEFERGEFTTLCNVAIYTTGYDCPSVVNIIMYRATLSESLYLQIIGRGSRLSEGKEFFRILDFGGNVGRFGTFEQKREYSLWHDYKEGSGIPLTKECPTEKTDKFGKKGCGRLLMIGAPECPFCGYVFTTPAEEREIELREVIGGVFKFTEMSAIQLKAYAEMHGYKMGWVYRQLFIGNEERDFRKGMRDLGYDNKFIYRTLQMFKAKKK